MIKITFERTLSNAYGLYDYRIVPFDGDNYNTITGVITLNDVQIGTMTLYELFDNTNLGDMCYQIPGDVAILAEVLCDYDGNLLSKYACRNGHLVILDNIHIDPEYRNKGYGSLVIKHLMQTLNDAYNHEIEMLVLYASIYDLHDCEEMSLDCFNAHADRLVKFYSKAGFELVENYVMIQRKEW